MKKLLGLVLLMFNISAFATDQSMDVMIYNDSVSFLFASNLLGFDHRPIRGYPLDNFLYRQDTDSIQEKVNREVTKCYRWCMRGYIAKWEVRNDSLFLLEISYMPTVTAYVEAEPESSFPLQRLFPDRKVTNGVFAYWYTGIINTVLHQSVYPPFDSDKWKDKRKRFFVKDGKVINIIRM